MPTLDDLLQMEPPKRVAQPTRTLDDLLDMEPPEPFDPDMPAFRAAPERTVPQKIGDFFTGKPGEGRLPLPPDASRMEKIDRTLHTVADPAIRGFTKFTKGRLLGTPDVAWAAIKRVTPDNIWDEDVKEMNLDQAMDWAMGYDPSGFTKAATGLAEFSGSLKTAGGIQGAGPKDTNVLSKALAGGQKFAMAKLGREMSKFGAEIIDPETDYQYEGAQSVIVDFGLGGAFSLLSSASKPVLRAISKSPAGKAMANAGHKVVIEFTKKFPSLADTIRKDPQKFFIRKTIEYVHGQGKTMKDLSIEEKVVLKHVARESERRFVQAMKNFTPDPDIVYRGPRRRGLALPGEAPTPAAAEATAIAKVPEAQQQDPQMDRLKELAKQAQEPGAQEARVGDQLIKESIAEGVPEDVDAQLRMIEQEMVAEDAAQPQAAKPKPLAKPSEWEITEPSPAQTKQVGKAEAIETEQADKVVPDTVEDGKLTRGQAIKHGHALPKSMNWDEDTRKAFNKKITGKESMGKMTTAEMNKVVAAMYDELRGIPTGNLPKGAKVAKEPAHIFREPKGFGEHLTSQNYYAERLGVKFITEASEIAKQKFDIEFPHRAREVDLQIKKINDLAGTTLNEKARARIRNRPTKAVEKFFDLLDKNELPPDSLSMDEKKIFNYFRAMTKQLLKLENDGRIRRGMPTIPNRKAYVRHIYEGVARDIIDQQFPIPKDLSFQSREKFKAKIYNSMEFQRQLAEELDAIYSKDLGRVTKSMLHTALKEIYLAEPLDAAKAELDLVAKDIPASTRKWTEQYLNQVIKGQATDTDLKWNRLIKDSSFGAVLNRALLPFGRTIGASPFTRAVRAVGRLQIYGVLGWRPKQLIRNKFQVLQNLALYTFKANVKSYGRMDATLKRLMTEGARIDATELGQLDETNLFLKSYTAFEELPVAALRKLGKLWLAPFQWTAMGNARRAMRTAYWDTADLITNKKYAEYEWADPKRTYTEDKGFYYESELKKLEKEMVFGASVTQYHYIPMAMPGIFRVKSATPFTRLQSWWMNHFFKFHREALIRLSTGRTGYGQKIPPSRRLGWARYMIIGGAILTTLGYGGSYMRGVTPEDWPPFAKMITNFYKMFASKDARARKSARRLFLLNARTFIPGNLSYRELKNVWTGRKDLKSIFVYEGGIFKKKKFKSARGS